MDQQAEISVDELLPVTGPEIPGTVRFDYLDIRDERVQEFVWEYLNPKDIRHDFTKLQAMREVSETFLDRRASLYGDLDRGVALRVDFPTPTVACPHLMGNGIYARSMIRIGTSVLFGMGVRYINVITQYPSIIKMLEPHGYKNMGAIPGMAKDPDGNDELLHVVSLFRDDYYSEA